VGRRANHLCKSLGQSTAVPYRQHLPDRENRPHGKTHFASIVNLIAGSCLSHVKISISIFQKL
jgi:hypothetical protein